jgi:hypothetical protein
MRNEVMMSNLVGLHPNIIPVCDVLKSSREGGEGVVTPVCGDNLTQMASTARLRRNGLPCQCVQRLPGNVLPGGPWP